MTDTRSEVEREVERMRAEWKRECPSAAVRVEDVLFMGAMELALRLAKQVEDAERTRDRHVERIARAGTEIVTLAERVSTMTDDNASLRERVERLVAEIEKAYTWLHCPEPEPATALAILDKLLTAHYAALSPAETKEGS